jgi:hypothetical protein
LKVVIRAGGFGTRITEESATKPKPMVDIGGRPMLFGQKAKIINRLLQEWREMQNPANRAIDSAASIFCDATEQPPRSPHQSEYARLCALDKHGSRPQTSTRLPPNCQY